MLSEVKVDEEPRDFARADSIKLGERHVCFGTVSPVYKAVRIYNTAIGILEMVACTPLVAGIKENADETFV